MNKCVMSVLFFNFDLVFPLISVKKNPNDIHCDSKL